MNPKEVDLRAIGDEVEENCARLLLRSAEITKECRGIQFLSNEHLVDQIEYGRADPFVIELLKMNKALAELATDTAFALRTVVESIPKIRSSEKTRVWLMLRREKKSALAKAGKSGARSKHSKAYALKAWAEQEAKTMTGADKGIARQLAERIPTHLADASSDPERLIYDHLRALRNTAS